MISIVQSRRLTRCCEEHKHVHLFHLLNSHTYVQYTFPWLPDVAYQMIKLFHHRLDHFSVEQMDLIVVESFPSHSVTSTCDCSALYSGSDGYNCESSLFRMRNKMSCCKSMPRFDPRHFREIGFNDICECGKVETLFSKDVLIY